MYEKLIVGYCETDEGRDALALGQMLAGATGAQIISTRVLHGDVEGQVRKTAELARAAATAAGPQLTVRARVVQDHSPSRGLQDLAAQERADAIVLGSTHRGALGRVLAGSVAERLLAGAPCAVAVAPRGYREEDPEGRPRVLAVGFDGFGESQRALAAARALAEACGATLRVIAVDAPDAVFAYPAPGVVGAVEIKSERDRLERALHDALEELPGRLRAHGAVLSGDAAAVLAAEADKGVDLLVVGSRGHGPLHRVMTGGVSSTLMRTSPCPVLVVPRSAAADDGRRAPDVAGVSATEAPRP